MYKQTATLVLILSAGLAQAQSSVTIYGMMDISVGRSSTGSGTTLPGGGVATGPSARVTRMDSGAGLGSRLGFRGVEDLGGGLKTVFLAEMGLAADTGTLNQGGLAFGRQVYVGINGSSWGVTAGRQYTPQNLAVATFEPLGGGYWGHMNAQAAGTYEALGSAPGDGTYQLTQRADNSILLTLNGSPWTGRLMVGAGNENTRGTGRLVNASVVYDQGPLQATVSVLRMKQAAGMITATADPETLSQWTTAVKYDLGVAKLFAGYMQYTGPKNPANLSTAATLGAAGAAAQAYSWKKNKSAWVGASVPMPVGTLLAQVGVQRFSYDAAPDGRATIVGVAYEYPLSRRTLTYVNYGRVVNNERSRAPLYGAIPQVGPNGFGSDPSAISVGLRHTF